jgi:drug/metabolite transporter (DMT)-like permease
MCVIWGIPYLLIRVAVRDFSPGTMVCARTAPAAALLLPWAFSRGAFRGVGAAWRPVLLYTIVEVALPWWLLGKAEQRLPSSLTGLLVAAVPLIGAGLSWALREEERLDARRFTGLLIGLAGVISLVGVDVTGGSLGATAAVLVVAACYATGPLIITRRLGHLPALGVVTASITLTALAYAPYAATHWPDRIGVKPALSVLTLATVCTAAAFLIFFALIAEVGPARAVVITYVNPVVAITLGVLLLSEPFTLGLAVGTPLVLVGCVLATARSRDRDTSLDADPAGGLASVGRRRL